MKTALAVLCILVAFAVGFLVNQRVEQPGRYQVVSLEEGKKSFLDTKQGKIWDVGSFPWPEISGWRKLPPYSDEELQKVERAAYKEKAREFGIDTTITIVPPDSEVLAHLQDIDNYAKAYNKSEYERIRARNKYLVSVGLPSEEDLEIERLWGEFRPNSGKSKTVEGQRELRKAWGGDVGLSWRYRYADSLLRAKYK